MITCVRGVIEAIEYLIVNVGVPMKILANTSVKMDSTTVTSMASVWRRITLCKISLWCGIRVDAIEETESEWWNSWLRIVELRKGDFGVWNEWPSSNTQVTKLIFETFEDTSLEVRVVNLALARSCELIRKRFYFVQKLSDRKVTLFDTSQLHMNLKNTGIGGRSGPYFLRGRKATTSSMISLDGENIWRLMTWEVGLV